MSMTGNTNQNLEILKQGARDRLISFCAFIDKDYMPQDFHYQIAEKLEGVERGDIKRLMIFLPPRAGKSRLATQFFTSRFLGRNKNKKVVVAGYGQDLPNLFSRETQRIVEGELYPHLFDIKQTTSNVAHRETESGGYYHAVGVGGPLTGYGFDLGIIDDPIKNREEAESIVYRQKVWDWYTSTFLTRKMDDKASIILILTRWHIDDLAGRILKQSEEGGQKWDVISFPAIQDGQSFRPERFSIDDLLEQKNAIGVRDFSALYMQDPIMSTGSIFKPSDFRYFLLSDFEKINGLNKKDIKLGIFVDPAFSTNQSSDDAVVMVAGRHLTRNELYVFDIYADTSAPSRTIDAVFNLGDRWRLMGYDVDFVSIENVSINKDQMQFKETFKQEMSRRNQYYVLYEFSPKGKKEDRIKFQLEPLIANQKCFFVKGHGDFGAFKKLEEQLTLFPSSKKDDVMDTLAQARQVFLERGKPKKTETAPRQYYNSITGKFEFAK